MSVTLFSFSNNEDDPKLLRVAAKKSSILSGLGGGGLNGHEEKVPKATKPRGGGGIKALGAGPLRKDLFFVASLRQNI